MVQTIRKTPKNGGMITGKRGMPEGTVRVSGMKNPGSSLNPVNPGSDNSYHEAFAIKDF
ncbi:MAG: hypothetical protein AB7S75_22490 [Desulfococcaceae bacterium]